MNKLPATATISNEPRRHLSIWRVLFALLVLGGLGAGVFMNWGRWLEFKSTSPIKPWFAPYVDVTATPAYPFEQKDGVPGGRAVLSFVVASPNNPCQPTWGAYYDFDQASDNLDLDRRIARLRQQEGEIVISFGGLINDELALKCSKPDQLQDAYQAVIDRYQIDTLDFDLEGDELTDIESQNRRAVVLAQLQQKQRAANQNLAIWLTLPMSPQGLTKEGTDAVSIMLKNGVDLAGVNVMTMNYNNSKEEGESLAKASQRGLEETHRQLGILYRQVNIDLSSASLWRKIGVTPMIGQNDVADEIFSLEDANQLNQYSLAKGVGRMSMWSLNRDLQCGDNYVDLKIVSDSCSGVKQAKFAFSNTLAESFDGELRTNSALVTSSDPQSNVTPTDDPQTSPYQIWNKSARYLAGTKVVWHRNVYQAKWWTQGDLPDNPVLQSWETPWQLLGPVLPGEKPIPQPTLPPGTYEEWSGNTEYSGGQRVLFEGLPYQAKWWTKGDSPAASTENPDSSPWSPLTKAQFDDLINESKDQ